MNCDDCVYTDIADWEKIADTDKVDQSCDFKGVRTATMWVKVIKPK